MNDYKLGFTVVSWTNHERKKMDCETCHLSGYSSEFCKLHRKMITEVDFKNRYPRDFYKRMGKRAVLGAGVGVVATTFGLAAAPAVGLKMAVGHALAAKITAGGGAACAGINVTRGTRKGHPRAKLSRKRHVLMPLYLKKGG